VRSTANSVLSYRAARGRMHERALAKTGKELNRITTEMTRHGDLEKDLEKVRALRKKEQLLKKAVIRDHYTTGEIANETGYNRRHIARLAPTIPGALFSGTGWIFPKSEKLHLWIRDAIRKRKAAVRSAQAMHPQEKRVRGTKTVTRALYELVNCIREITRTRPISEWTIEEVDRFLDDAEPLAETIEDAQKRWQEINQ
jgi:hypothetical protein